MERGGGALRCNLSCWPLFSRSRTLLESRQRRRSSLRGAPAELFLVDRLRSFIFSKGKRNSIMPKALHKSHSSLRVFNSLGPQEPKLDQDGITKNLFLIDCATGQECVTGGIVALGKFDALHIGHRELAIQASKAGIPFFLSFVGMAEVLGWESRAPIVAKCDRKRVLSSWASHCGNVVPLEYQVEFSMVRHLTPRQFVERLSNELGISGVVAGENYRFGYKASGDASELVRLCREYDLAAYIVSPVMDESRPSCNGSAGGSDGGQVSSSRVRCALAMGDMGYVAELLGRKHRLVVEIDGRCLRGHGRISAPVSRVLNQMPKHGAYDRCTLVVDGASLGSCRVVVNAETVDVDFDGDLSDHGHAFLGIEFR